VGVAYQSGGGESVYRRHLYLSTAHGPCGLIHRISTRSLAHSHKQTGRLTPSAPASDRPQQLPPLKPFDFLLRQMRPAPPTADVHFAGLVRRMEIMRPPSLVHHFSRLAPSPSWNPHRARAPPFHLAEGLTSANDLGATLARPPLPPSSSRTPAPHDHLTTSHGRPSSMSNTQPNF